MHCKSISPSCPAQVEQGLCTQVPWGWQGGVAAVDPSALSAHMSLFGIKNKELHKDLSWVSKSLKY